MLNNKEYCFNINSINEEEIIETLIDKMLLDTSISIRECFDNYLRDRDPGDTYEIIGSNRILIDEYNYIKFILYKNIDLILFNTLERYIYKFIPKSKFINLRRDLVDDIIKDETRFRYNLSIEEKLKNIYKKFEYHMNITANSRLDELKDTLQPYKDTIEYCIKNNDYNNFTEKELRYMEEVIDLVYSNIEMIKKRGCEPEIKDILDLLNNTNKIGIYDFISGSLIEEIDFKSYTVTLRDIELIIEEDRKRNILLKKVCKIEENKIYTYGMVH